MQLLLIIFTLLLGCSSLNFVVYLTLIGGSHLDFLNSMVDELIKRGHNVDIVFGVLHSGVQWEGKTRARNATAFGFSGKNPWITTTHLQNPFDTTLLADFHHFYQTCMQLTKIGIESEIPVDFMKNGNYDALITSDYDYAGYIYAKKAGISKIMGFTSTAIMYLQLHTVGLPNLPSNNGGNLDLYGGDLSIWSKIKRLYFYSYQFHYYFPSLISQYNSITREKYGHDFPSVEVLARETDIMFVNSNELVEMPRIITHKIKYIGGIGKSEPKSLSKEFELILSSSKKGAVLVSFGTLVPSEKFLPRVKKALLGGFKNHPDYIFIWKYSKQPGDEKFFQGVDNVICKDWLPQNDLLYDERVVGFISHVGLNSLTEITHAGVPVVAIPTVSDQWYNGRNVVRLGIGVNLDKFTLSNKSVTIALNNILNDEKYKIQAKKLAKMLADHPEEAKKCFVKWAEFVATHENLHKQYNLPEAELDVFTYYCFDILAVFVSIAFIAFQSYKLLKSIAAGPKKEQEKIKTH